MSRDSFDYSHGDTGTEPSTALNFEPNERPDSEHFDWWWYTVIQLLNGHADEFDRLDSDNDGVVDGADTATEADNADTIDGKHASAFSESGHDHDGRYARLFDGVQSPVFPSVGDVPSAISTGEVVYIDGDGLYVEDGN